MGPCKFSLTKGSLVIAVNRAAWKLCPLGLGNVAALAVKRIVESTMNPCRDSPKHGRG